MQIEQIYTGCLAQGAYYIESEGEAVVIDPLRDIDNYLAKAKRNNAKIKYVFETHFHADFVSGHIDLANATGATIVFGPTAAPNFNAKVALDGERFKVGKLIFELLHTPGHTLESCCYLMYDELGIPRALFSGDTIFIGDVGRPDLAQKAANQTLEELAGLLFDSIRTKILPLSDEIVVYPAHGAGSACGKKLSAETIDTLGHQKATNYAMRADMSKFEFVKEVTQGLISPPGYFPYNVQMNKQGYESIHTIIERGYKAFSANAFEAASDETEAIIIDTRKSLDFGKGFIPKPGGDKIGRRRLDTHFEGFTMLGAKFNYDLNEHFYSIEAEKLTGTYIHLDEASVTGTANVLMAAVLAEGKTTIYNAACEPYLQQLCKMLNSMGANITGIGSNMLHIEGVKELGGCFHRILPDMIEIGSKM